MEDLTSTAVASLLALDTRKESSMFPAGRHGSFFLALACLAPASQGADVHVVDASGGGDFISLQAAIDAAADGDILLVESGTYASFTIDAKALTLVADRQAVVSVARASRVRNIGDEQTVVLSGLSIDHGGSQWESALALEQCVGSVRVHECILLGYDGLPGEHDQGKLPEEATGGAFAVDCDDLAFSASEIRGGHGGGELDELQGGTLPSGAAGLACQSSSVALYRTLLYGGDGGEDFSGSACGGSGGEGANVSGGSFFAVHSVFQGGDGKDGNDVIPCCGDGGAGLVIATAGAAEFSSFFYGGAGGCWIFGGPQCEWCSAGESILGSIQSFNGQPRAALMPRVVREGETYTIDYYGNPGDVVLQLASPLAGFDFRVPWRGVLLIAPPLALTSSVGTIPAGGVLSVTRVQGTLPPLVEGRGIHRQALLRAPSGARFLSNPTSFVVLDSSF